MNFWDFFIIGLMMDMREYQRDKMTLKEKQLEYQHKLSNEISDEILKLIDTVSGVFLKANPHVLKDDAIRGARMLPYYLFARILVVQGSSPTKAQNMMLDACFKTIKVDMTKKQFLTDNKILAEMHALVGLTASHLGTFWTYFLKAMYATNSEEDIVVKVSEHVASIMMRFAILGNANEEATLRLCENFLRDLIHHAIGVATAPVEDIDYLGEVTFLDHKQKARRIANDLVYADGAQDELSMNDLLDIYFVKQIYDLVEESRASRNEKIEILEEGIRLSGEDAGMSAEEIFDSIKAENDRGFQFLAIGDMTPMTINIMGSHTKREDDSVLFFQETTNFLIGLEKELAKKYPYCGLGRKAAPMMCKKIDEILKNLE